MYELLHLIYFLGIFSFKFATLLRICYTSDAARGYTLCRIVPHTIESVIRKCVNRNFYFFLVKIFP